MASYGCKSRFIRKSGGGGRRTATVPTIISSSSIPEEIYYEIFLRLPVKSLLACKCVCKNWYALISTSDFVKTHFAIQKIKNNPILMFAARNQIYSINYDSFSSSSSSSLCEFKDNAIDMDHHHPFKSCYCVGFMGSCNGIICIWMHHYRNKDVFYLWNPATKEYRELPKLPSEFEIEKVSAHGFGYDHKTDDYKLAVGVKIPGSNYSTLVQVYTLASNEWKTEITVPYLFCYSHISGVLVQGNLHWYVLNQLNNFLVVSLDVSDESFKEMQIPREILEVTKKILCLGLLQGYLSLFASLDVNGVKRHEVWKMLDYGIQESWTKHYVIPHESIINDQKYFRRVSSFKNDEILLLGICSLFYHDRKHGSTRELKTDDIPILNVENCFESLVSLNSGTYVGGELEESVETRRRNFLRKSSDYVFYFMFFIYVLAFIYDLCSLLLNE